MPKRGPSNSSQLPISPAKETSDNVTHDILCQLSPSYDSGTKNAIYRNTKVFKKADQVVPISNLPEATDDSDDEPYKRDLEVARLKRRIASLSSDKIELNDKLSYALHYIVDQVRFLKLGLYGGQWETYGQLQKRISKLETAVQHLLNCAPTGHTDAWQEYEKLFGEKIVPSWEKEKEGSKG